MGVYLQNRKTAVLLLAMIFSFLIWSFSTKAQGVPELMYYQFDAPGTSVANNASSPVGTNPAPFVGSQLTIGGTGQFSTALVGTGTTSTNDYINTGWNTSLATGPWTLSFWVNNLPSSTTLWYLFGDGGNSFRCFVNGAPGQGNMRLTGTGFTAVDVTGVTGGSYVLHFVRETTPASVIKVYKNGVFVNSVSVTITLATGTGLRIGGYASNTGLNGQFDEFRLYNRALDATEIANTWNTSLPAGPCIAPPSAGSSTASPSSGICAGSSVSLNLTGNSIGSGQTYQWESSPSFGGPYTPIGSPGSASGTTVTATTTMYYQAAVTCSSQTSYSIPVLVTVNPAFPGGTYTINSTQPTGGGNYQTFAAAVADISCGISGPVVFNVASGSGPYNEQVEIPATVGANATNTVTFNGNGATLTHTGTASNFATLNLDGADYITFKNLTINGTGTSQSFAVHLMNGADNNTFDSCTIAASFSGTATTSGAVSMSGSKTLYSTAGANGSNNTFSNCDISGGYFALALYGNSPGGNTGNTISNCLIHDYYVYGAYCIQQGSGIISDNIFERANRTPVSTGYGPTLSTGCTNMLVENNRIRKMWHANQVTTGTTYCMYNLATASAGNENKFYNNIVSDIHFNGTIYGFYNTGGTYLKVYHNTISLDHIAATGTTTTYGLYSTGATGIDLRNNNISITRGGTGVKACVYISAATGTTSNNNNLFINAAAGTNYTGSFNGAGSASLALWQAANGNAWDQASQSADPLFANPTAGDYTPTNSLIDNMGAPLGVTNDINGAVRSMTTPDVGAIEFSVPLCTSTPVAGTASVVGGATTACPGGSLNFSLAGFTIGTGIDIQWQESPAGAGVWTSIPGATSSTTSVVLSAPTDYRAMVTCSNGGGVDYSNTLSINTNPMYLCYCSPLTNVTLHGTTANYITAVVIPTTTLNSTTSAVGAGGYTQLSHTVASNTATLTQGQSYTLNATIANATYSTDLWIDWDQSGTFDASEYSLLTPGTTSTTTITVPITATPGLTGLRLRNTASTVNHTSTGACANISVGRETEDYVITVAAGVQCSGTPSNAGTLTASTTSICNGAGVSFTLAGYTTELGISLQWESSPAGQNNYTPITGANGASYTATAMSASTDYRVAVTCTNAGGGTAYSNTIAITVNNPQIISSTPGTRCGVGTVNLSATASAGNIVNWYAAATGGLPLATNTTTFTTPSISSTTTFYAAAATPGAGSATMGLPGAGTNYTGNVRGFWFTAPVSFTITALEPLATGGGNQSLAVVKFDNNTPPPTYSATTNAFTVLYLLQNTAGTGPVSVNIPVNSGEVIGILGQVATNSAYATPTGPYVTTIGGQTTTLTRMGMQFPLTTTAPQDLWQEPGGAIGRVAMTYSDNCEGTRTAILASVTAPPAYTVAANPDTLCLGGSSTVSVSSANAYTYSWTPTGSGTSFSVSPTTTTTYYVSGSDANNCNISDSVTVTVKSVPANVAAVVAQPDICVSGNADLSLNPTPMAGIGIQWQKNTGSGFADITGANSATLSDPVTANASYQAKFFCNSNQVGTSTPVSVTFSNPSVAQTFPGSRCGTGFVTLAAIGAPAGATIRWYAAATGGSPLGTGNSFTTPSIASTTTYYAAAMYGGGGTGALGLPNRVGATTNSGYTDIGLMFDALTPFTIQSVSVYPVGTGGNVTATIQLKNSTGTVLQTTTVNLPTTASPGVKTLVPLNFSVPVGTGHRLVFQGASGGGITGFIREAGSGYTYPYTLPGIASITSAYTGGASSSYYYYFYDWQVTAGCESARVPVDATINGASSGTGLSSGGTTLVSNQADGTTVTYTDACNDIVATVDDAAGGNVLGLTSAVAVTSAAVQTHAGKPFVPRMFDIAPTSSGPATVTLYVLQTEFNAYNSYVTTNSLPLPLLPTGPADIAGMNNIVITQYHGAASAGSAGPLGLYSNANVSFIPNSSITRSSNGTYWTLTFPVTGFSGFFIHSGTSPLAIDLRSISALNAGSRNRVDWATASETKGDQFELERSADGRSFTRIASLPAKGQPADYTVWDESPVTGINYYRLKLIDVSGNSFYSKTVSATVKSGYFHVEAYPNPVGEMLTVKLQGQQGETPLVLLTDVSGRVIRSFAMNSATLGIDMKGLAAGVYLIKYSDKQNSQTIKVNKL